MAGAPSGRTHFSAGSKGRCLFRVAAVSPDALFELSFRRLLPALVALAVAACATEPQPFETGPALVLVNGTLVDGTGARPVTDGAVVMRGGRILFAGSRGRLVISPEAEVVDVGGGTILPGFIDAHVHGAYSAAALLAWARAGVTTVRDEAVLSGATLGELIARRDSAWSGPAYARLVSAGLMITAPGGYGSLGIRTPEDARRAVDGELEEGADLIKVALEDGIGGQTDLPVLATEALLTVVAAAHARGRPVSAHVTDARFLQIAVDARVDDAAHATWDAIPETLLRRMVERRIAMVPTLTVFEPFGSLASAQANLRRFVQLGGTVALGDDYAGLPPSSNAHFRLGMPLPEIQWMAQAGMTPLQIIVAATRNAARVCGLGSELGTLEPGKTADVLVVSGNPLADLNALENVRLVVHRGVVIRS